MIWGMFFIFVIQSSFRDNSKKYHQKILSQDEYQRERAKTAAALLAILEEL